MYNRFLYLNEQYQQLLKDLQALETKRKLILKGKNEETLSAQKQTLAIEAEIKLMKQKISDLDKMDIL